MQEMKETWVRSLGQEDPLEKGMATHSSILAWRIPWTEEPGGATVHRVANSWTQLKRQHARISLRVNGHLYIFFWKNIYFFQLVCFLTG